MLRVGVEEKGWAFAKLKQKTMWAFYVETKTVKKLERQGEKSSAQTGSEIFYEA